MRILELGKFYPPDRGGIETLLRLWCEGFVAAGDEVDCVVANRTARTERSRINGVHVHRLASLGTAMSTSICPSFPTAPYRYAADLIHSHFPNPLADIACVLAPSEIPVVITWHSDIVRQRSVLRFYKPLQDALLRRANQIVVATPNHLTFSDWLPAFQEKVVVIPFGLDLRRFESTALDAKGVAELRESAGGRKVLLNVGRLVGYKGQRYAIDALKELPDTVLWLVGAGPLEDELHQHAAAQGVARRVVFWGDVADPELPYFFEACDVFVFPSISPNEAFGLVQVEAMACGKPVIATDLRSGVPWVCREGVTGRIVAPGSGESLALALKPLLSNAVLRRQMGEAGRARAYAEFSAPVMIQRYQTLFDSLIRTAAAA
jgi:rhamnosyl/mannosyltransferase